MAVVNLKSEPSKGMSTVDRWIKRIKREQDIHEDFRDDSTDAQDVYLKDVDSYEVFYPLLWSVVQVEMPAVFSDTPTPDVRCRGGITPEKEKVYKDAAEVVQRALEVTVDTTAFDCDMGKGSQDLLVAGLGQTRVKIDAMILEEDSEEPVIADQQARIEHVPWDRFGWEPCSNWVHVNWVYFEHHLYPSEVKRRWPDAVIGANQEENVNRDKSRRNRTKNEQAKIIIYEVWNKKTREVLIIAEGSTEPLEVIEDPLELEDFFPCPPPMMTTVASDDLIPTADYCYIKPFDTELQRLYKRRRSLTEQVKAASLHDASLVEIEDLESIEDGDSVPVSNMEARMDGADIRKVIMFYPLEERVRALEQVTLQIELVRRHVDDLMGISDILRGSSNPQDGQETQKIKERWSGIRLRPKQIMVQEHVRYLFCLLAELIVEHYTLENLQEMTQMQISPEVYAVLRDNKLRQFLIDVETDSTIAKDEFAERQARGELMQGLTQYVQIVGPSVQQGVIPADLAKEILKIAVDPYKKYSRDMDDVIEQMPGQMQQLQQMQGQIQQGQAQIQQLTEQIQQKDYALAQFSEREERRQDAEQSRKGYETQIKDRDSQVKAQESGAKVAEIDANITEKEAKTRLTEAQTVTESVQPEKVLADADLAEAKAADTLRPEPPRPATGE